MNRVVKSCCVAAFFVLLLFSDGSDASDLEIDVASAPADVLELVDFTIIDGTATLLDATGNPYSGISFTRSKEFFDDTPFLPWELFNSGLKKIIVPGKSLTVDVGRGRSYIFGDSSSASEGEKVFIGTFDSPMENISIHSDYYINNSGGLVTTQSARNGRSIFLNAENIELSVGYKTPAPFKSENRCVLGSGKKSYGGEIVLNASKSLTIDGDICNNYNPYEDSGRINPDAPILYSNAHSITLNAGEQNADSDVRVKGDMYCAGVYYQGTIYNGNSINAYFRTADSLFRGKAYTCSDRGDPDATGMIPGGCDPTKNEGVNLDRKSVV